MDHPIPGTTTSSIAGINFSSGQQPLESVQVIIPGPQVGRVNDIFVCSMGHTLHASAPGVYIAIVSTLVENQGNPDADVAPGLQLLGPIVNRFMSVSTTYEPVSDGVSDRCFISKSMDATSHFESDVADMLDLYQRVTGEPLDLNINADSVEGDY